MKLQKGVTLISLTVYIIAMVIVVSVVSMISTYYFTNITSNTSNLDALTQYTTFNRFFSKEIHKKEIEVIKNIEKDEKENSYLCLKHGEAQTQYSFIKANRGIYKDKVKICRDVESASFVYHSNEKTITITMKIGKEAEKTITYQVKTSYDKQENNEHEACIVIYEYRDTTGDGRYNTCTVTIKVKDGWHFNVTPSGWTRNGDKQMSKTFTNNANESFGCIYQAGLININVDRIGT